MSECWFCGNKNNLMPHERERDSAPYLNDDGSPQMVCTDCVLDMRGYRERILAEVKLDQLRMTRSLMSDRDYASWAKNDQRKKDVREGFED